VADEEWKMRLRRESLLGAEAPKAFHALRGRRIFLAWPPQKEPKTSAHVLVRPQIVGKNLIQSSRLHPAKSINFASQLYPSLRQIVRSPYESRLLRLVSF